MIEKNQTYENIFSSDIEKQIDISKLMQQCLRTCEELIFQKQKEDEQ